MSHAFDRRPPSGRIKRAVAASGVMSAAMVFVCLSGSRAFGQDVARYSLESVVAVDEFAGENAVHSPQIVVDVSAAVRLGRNWQLFVRPWFRLPRPAAPGVPQPAWDAELYQAGIRYERPGAIATRLDIGYILSPIGLGLFDVRPGINPTIVPHLSYLQPMPPFDPTGPRVSAVAASYPLGTQLTVSTSRWDARTAVINAAPTRAYVVGGTNNPKQTPVLVAGAGITPTIGVRVGATIAQGTYATAEELTFRSGSSRRVTMVSGEGEWAFSGTKVTGEILHSAFDTQAATPSIAYEFFIQGQQTLTPRWFAASRFEGTSAPPLVNGFAPGARTELRIFEATVGYRLSPDFTLRGSYHTRRLYGAATWTDQVGASVVWAHRWW
jgi:hypothetical protein